MKTADEIYNRGTPLSLTVRTFTYSEFKEAQLDAWKQGMSDAAEVADITMQGRSSMVNQDQWLGEIIKNILTARENKTSL